MDRLRIARDGYLVMAVLLYLSGIICIIPGEMTPLAACVICGLMLLGYGIIKIIGYLSDDMYCLAFQFDMAGGICLAVLGIIVLSCNVRLYPYLNLGLGLLILIHSLLTVQTAKDAKVFGLKLWYLLLGTAILAGVFGVLLLIHTPGQVHRFIVGGALIAEGLLTQVIVHLTVTSREQLKRKDEEI